MIAHEQDVRSHSSSALPPVSVVMPVYNGQQYLAQAIESILQQTAEDFEFIIVDDGSTDSSKRIIEQYQRHDRRITLISRPNTGIVGALNDGLAESRCEIIARMDADDVALPQRFEKQLLHLEMHPEITLLGTRVLLIDADGLPICEWAMETKHEAIDHGHLNGLWPMVHPTIMVRREAIMAIGGYREAYATQEDLDLFFRIAERGQLANLPDVLLHYRQHFGSICHLRASQQREVRRALFAETYARRGIEPPRIMLTSRPPRSPNKGEHRWMAWKALDAGYVRTARKHALRVMRDAPINVESWRLMYCALRGY